MSYKETFILTNSYFLFHIHWHGYKLLLIKTCIVTILQHDHHKKKKCYIDKETYKNWYFVSLNWVSTFQLFKHRFFNFKIFEFNFHLWSMIFHDLSILLYRNYCWLILDYNHDFGLKLFPAYKCSNIEISWLWTFSTWKFLSSIFINDQWSSMIIQYCCIGIITE